MIEQLQLEVMSIVGLSIVNGRVFDTDTGQYLMFNGGRLFVRWAPDAFIFHKNDIEFDIMNNRKIADYILNVYLQKEREENGLYVKLIYCTEQFDPKNPQVVTKRALNINTNTETITTDKYYNYCLACIEMIYRISGTPLNFDLSSIDYTKDLMESIGRKS